MTWWGWLAFWMLIYLAQALAIGFEFSHCKESDKDFYIPYALVICFLLTMMVSGIVHYNL